MKIKFNNINVSMNYNLFHIYESFYKKMISYLSKTKQNKKQIHINKPKTILIKSQYKIILGLKDIHVGSEPALIHEYIICGALVLFLVLLAAYAVYRLWPVFKAALAMIIVFFKSVKYPQELNSLLKETSLKLYKRDQVAKLTGRDWLDFLDRRSLSNFRSFADRWDEILYSRCDITRGERRSLLINSLLWILSNFWRALWQR